MRHQDLAIVAIVAAIERADGAAQNFDRIALLINHSDSMRRRGLRRDVTGSRIVPRCSGASPRRAYSLYRLDDELGIAIAARGDVLSKTRPTISLPESSLMRLCNTRETLP